MDVRAPLAGTIWKIKVEVGAQVEEDDEILILEAMKMETPLYAPCSGAIGKIEVKEADKVQENQLLLTIE